MGFIPSGKLSEVLSNTSVGLWVEQLGGGRTALVFKAPESAIKALHLGAACMLLLSTIQAEALTILCLGLAVEDEPERPFKALIANCSAEDTTLLVQILESGTTTLHCINELNHCVLSARCSLEPESASVAANALSSSTHWLLTAPSIKLVKLPDLSQMLEIALDRFQDHLYRSLHDPVSEHVKMTASVPLNLDIWSPSEIFEITPTVTGGPFCIVDENEGSKLEKMIHVVVDSIYPGNSYLSPDVQDGDTRRELADVLGFDSDFICVVQAKALAVLTVNSKRSSSKRTANVEKDIRKGLKQLAGALTNVREGALVFPHGEDTPIVIPNRKISLGHGIVVLSEMYTLVDWNVVAASIAEFSDSNIHRTLFHVVDIRELTSLTANCKDAETFGKRLVQRWLVVRERGTAYVRVKGSV